jgi:hypothetical protein
MTYTIAVCTEKNSLWWTEELSETCRNSFQNKFEKLVHLVGFTRRNLTIYFWGNVWSRMSNRIFYVNTRYYIGLSSSKIGLANSCNMFRYTTLRRVGFFLGGGEVHHEWHSQFKCRSTRQDWRKMVSALNMIWLWHFRSLQVLDECPIIICSMLPSLGILQS